MTRPRHPIPDWAEGAKEPALPPPEVPPPPLTDDQRARHPIPGWSEGILGPSLPWPAAIVGLGEPDDSVGEDGDYYLRLPTFMFYGPKADGSWPDDSIPYAPGVYEFVQTSTVDTWTINHNLGFYPSVSIFTMGGIEVDAEIQHISLNQVRVRFAAPMAGRARLN
jgi:hypothetical protein